MSVNITEKSCLMVSCQTKSSGYSGIGKGTSIVVNIQILNITNKTIGNLISKSTAFINNLKKITVCCLSLLHSQLNIKLKNTKSKIQYELIILYCEYILL